MAERQIGVTVMYSPGPREVREWALHLPAQASVADAIRATGIASEVSTETLDALVPGIWGRKAAPDSVLKDHDRVELYRPLRVDPKVARRERFTRQGSRAAGLFAKRK